jgi:uncharacterized protein (TIGR03084 family)
MKAYQAHLMKGVDKMEQADAFLEDSRQLFNLIKDQLDNVFQIKTQFKNWTINDVIGHLHIFNFAANLSLKSSDEFKTFFAPIGEDLVKGASLIETHRPWLKGLSGRSLLEAWWSESQTVAQNFKSTDPKLRLKWAGPDMSARSSITARQMETWAHGQEVFDILGKTRVETDRIKNIVHLGVSTFGWTFKNRGLEIPSQPPFIQLKSPSGEIWEWNELSTVSKVKGSAVDFASVVTQTRNVLDTQLTFTGTVANKWLSLAQCFAGPPKNPPKPSTRFCVDL